MLPGSRGEGHQGRQASEARSPGRHLKTGRRAPGPHPLPTTRLLGRRSGEGGAVTEPARRLPRSRTDGRGLVRLVGLVPSSWVFTASWREIGQGSVMGCCQTVSKRKPDTAPDGFGGVRVPGRRSPSASATAPCAGPERPPSSLLPRRSASGRLQRAACAFAVNAE